MNEKNEENNDENILVNDFKLKNSDNNKEGNNLPNNNYSMANKVSFSKKNRQNVIKIDNSDLEFVDINENFTKKPNSAPFDEVCSICSSKIYFKKYICIVCRDCILCQSCQAEHLHPMLRCKEI